MRNAILLLCVLAVVGCDFQLTEPYSVNPTSALTRYVDKENGVICYEQRNLRTLSCVKVSGGEHGN